MGSIVGPLIIPDHWYLSWYLPEEAKKETKQFLKGNHLLIPDNFTGWKNHPQTRRGNWVIDVHGSRSTHDFDTKRYRSIRVLFLGSSMINGGTKIKNSETISAYLEDKEIESLNFGTMLYSLDQIFLAYRSDLYQYNTNIIIIGLDVNLIGGLKNHYIPFRFPQEINMPFLKPRFKVSGESIELVTIPVEAMLSDLLINKKGMEFLEDNDEFYYVFETYKRMDLTPILGSIRFTYIKFKRFKEFFIEDIPGFQLLKLLMREMVSEARKHEAKVIFIMLPNERVFSNSKIYGILPDIYQRIVDEINSWGFEIMDARNIFKDSRKSSRDLFAKDGEHYTPVANHLIADAIRRFIKPDLESKRRLSD